MQITTTRGGRRNPQLVKEMWAYTRNGHPAHPKGTPHRGHDKDAGAGTPDFSQYPTLGRWLASLSAPRLF